MATNAVEKQAETYLRQAEVYLLDHADNPDVMRDLVRFLAERADDLHARLNYIASLKPALDDLVKRAIEAKTKRKAPAPIRPTRFPAEPGGTSININLGGRVRRFVSERSPSGEIMAMVEEPIEEPAE